MHKLININNKTPCIINTISQNQIDIEIRNSNDKYMYNRCQTQYLRAWLVTHKIGQKNISNTINGCDSLIGIKPPLIIARM